MIKDSDSTQTNTTTNTAFKRIVALIIDFITFGIIGLILSFIAKDFFVHLGIHGILVGWFITTAYYTIFNSNLANGQSIGKSAMKLKVVKYDGTNLNLKEGLIRSLAFTTPFFLFEYFQDIISQPIISNIFGGLTIAYYVGLLYFFLANSDRRTIHDLIAKTVVKIQNQSQSLTSQISQLKIYVYIGIIVSILGGFIGTYYYFRGTASVLTEVVEANTDVLTELATEIYQLDEVQRVQSSKIHVNINSEIGIVIEAWITKNVNSGQADEIYQDIMAIIASKTFRINRIDYSEVVLNYGYDIGIADYKVSRSWKNEYGK